MDIQVYKGAYGCIEEHMGGIWQNVGGLGLIRQLVCVWKEMAFLSTFKVAPVLVYLHLLVLGHVIALVQNRQPRKYINTIVLISFLINQPPTNATTYHNYYMLCYALQVNRHLFLYLFIYFIYKYNLLFFNLFKTLILILFIKIIKEISKILNLLFY